MSGDTSGTGDPAIGPAPTLCTFADAQNRAWADRSVLRDADAGGNEFARLFDIATRHRASIYAACCGMTPLPSRNVLGGPLKSCSHAPRTGFFRNGHCDTCAEDVGCHTVCVEVTESFLKHSQLIGNDLSTPRPDLDFPGLKPGDRWCVCAARWLELLEQNVTAPVVLGATHARTLEIVPLELLQLHATA